MPGIEAFGGKGAIVMARRVQHHFHAAFDDAVCRFRDAGIHPKATGDAGADLFGVQSCAFDFAGFDDIGGQCLQNGFLA